MYKIITIKKVRTVFNHYQKLEDFESATEELSVEHQFIHKLCIK